MDQAINEWNHGMCDLCDTVIVADGMGKVFADRMRIRRLFKRPEFICLQLWSSVRLLVLFEHVFLKI